MLTDRLMLRSDRSSVITIRVCQSYHLLLLSGPASLHHQKTNINLLNCVLSVTYWFVMTLFVAVLRLGTLENVALITAKPWPSTYLLMFFHSYIALQCISLPVCLMFNVTQKSHACSYLDQNNQVNLNPFEVDYSFFTFLCK